MTTQTGKAFLSGPQGAAVFTATLTDQAGWTEIYDEVMTQSLGDVMVGMTINAVGGEYAAGFGFLRVVNVQTGQLKATWAPKVIKGNDKLEFLQVPFRVEIGDVVQMYIDVAPT